MISDDQLIQLKVLALNSVGPNPNMATVRDVYDWLISTSVDAECKRRKEQEDQKAKAEFASNAIAFNLQAAQKEKNAG